MGFLQFFNKFQFKKKSPSLRYNTGRDSPAVSAAHTAGLNDEGERLEEGPTVDQGVNADISNEEVGNDSGHSSSHEDPESVSENTSMLSPNNTRHRESSERAGLWRRIVAALLRGWDVIMNITTFILPSRLVLSYTVRDLSECLTEYSEHTVAESNISDIYTAKLNGATMVAVKQLRRGEEDPRKIKRRIEREKSIWESLHHPNIAPFIGFIKSRGKYGALISPWYPRGNAKKCLVSFRPSKRFELWCEVLEGVIYLHSHQPVVIHGDLKLTNILIDDQEHARICDFGLARILSETKTDLTTTTNYTGSLRYMAYELARTDEPFTVPTASSDMYAMGCLGLELIFLQEPHKACQNNPALYAAIGHNKPPAQWGLHNSAVPEPVRQLMTILERCWEVNPVNRPTAMEFKNWVTSNGTEVSNALETRFDTLSTSLLAHR